MTADNRIQARLSADTAAWLDDRASRMDAPSRHVQAAAELALWRLTLAAELRGVRLTLGEASCVAEVLAGPLMTPMVTRSGTVCAACWDAFSLARGREPAGISSYGAQHGIDEGRLLKYLGSLSPAADLALADAISRWWGAGAEASEEGFAGAGLRVTR
jgi:hypothetical protein